MRVTLNRAHQVVKAAGWLLSVLVLICTLAAETSAGPNDDILVAAKAGDRSGVEAALASGSLWQLKTATWTSQSFC
jgi:hypothetical protein